MSQAWLTPGLALQEAVQSGTDDVKAAALEVVGNLAYPLPNREPLLATPGLREWLIRLASPSLAGVKQRVRVAAVRALAILGSNPGLPCEIFNLFFSFLCLCTII